MGSVEVSFEFFCNRTPAVQNQIPFVYCVDCFLHLFVLGSPKYIIKHANDILNFIIRLGDRCQLLTNCVVDTEENIFQCNESKEK
jgi:hypothetical protein